MRLGLRFRTNQRSVATTSLLYFQSNWNFGIVMSIGSLICDECFVRGQLMGSHLISNYVEPVELVLTLCEAVVLIIGAESPVYSCSHSFF
jgi:hypothetical protein